MSVLYEYPVSIPVYPIRLDNYTNLPVRTGLIHHTFEAHKDDQNQLIHKKMNLNEFNKLLQCPIHQPDLGSSGVFEMLKLIPTTTDIIEMMCAYTEKRDFSWKAVQENRKQFKEGDCYQIFFGPDSQGHQRFRLYRVMQGKLYTDWPWCHIRNRIEEIDKQYLHPIHFILNKLTDIGDSVFFLGGQDPFLPWNFPFLHFHPAPSVMTNHVPWPWPEAVRSEFAVYNRINVDYEGNFTEDNIRLATDDIPWKDKVSKAALYASYAPLRHLAYELGRIYPDLIDAYFDCTPSLVTESWHPLSTEPPIHPHAFAFNTSYMTAETRERLKNQRPGYASNLIDVCAKERPQYHRGAYKYNTVPTSSKALSTSGRLAHLLAHSGSVILLVSSQYSYHFSARLQPWVHYVPISYSMADLKERVQWLQEHDDLAQQIAENARNFARSFLRMEDYYCFAAAAMDSAAKSYKSIDSLKAFHLKLVKEDNCCCCQW